MNKNYKIAKFIRINNKYKAYNDEKEIIKLYEKEVNDLQSKIDKANEYLESHFIFDDENGEYYQSHTFDKDNAKELHEILKEDK